MDLLAASAITWTPLTFYVAAGIIQTIAVLLAFRALQVDVENNSFIGAAIAVAVYSGVAYAFKDAGIIGVMATIGATFGMLVLVTSGEALKALGVTAMVFALYGILGNFIVSRTPLTLDDIAGIPRVVASGGLEAEPMTEDSVDQLNEAGAEDEDEYEYEE